jgi:hypothetical protein
VNAALTVVAVLVAAGALRALVQTLPPLRRAAPASGSVGGEAPATASTSTAWSAPRRAMPASCTCACARSCARSRPTGLRRRGVDLDAEPQAAQELLAPETWELVRPDRPRPDDAFARGLAPARLNASSDDLEALLR